VSIRSLSLWRFCCQSSRPGLIVSRISICWANNVSKAGEFSTRQLGSERPKRQAGTDTCGERIDIVAELKSVRGVDFCMPTVRPMTYTGPRTEPPPMEFNSTWCLLSTIERSPWAPLRRSIGLDRSVPQLTFDYLSSAFPSNPRAFVGNLRAGGNPPHFLPALTGDPLPLSRSITADGFG